MIICLISYSSLMDVTYPSLFHVVFPAQRKWREYHQTWVILPLGTSVPPLPPTPFRRRNMRKAHHIRLTVNTKVSDSVEDQGQKDSGSRIRTRIKEFKYF
jgi:hypothetical protein